MRDFFIEISVEKDGKIVTLDTDDMDINIYQKIGGESVRIFEIMCYKGPLGAMTVAEFVGKKNCEDIDMRMSPDKVMNIYSE